MVPCGSLIRHCQEGCVNKDKVQGQWKKLAG